MVFHWFSLHHPAKPLGLGLSVGLLALVFGAACSQPRQGESWDESGGIFDREETIQADHRQTNVPSIQASSLSGITIDASLQDFIQETNPANQGLPASAISFSDTGNEVTIWTDGTKRYIKANGIPDHTPGQFPNAGNPNTIRAQDYSFEMPLNPTLAPTITDRGGPFGIALNGVPFDPGTAEFWNNGRRSHERSDWRYEALSGNLDLGLDRSNAHVQPTGAYHYHGIPTGLIELLSEGRFTGLVGYAADGFPVYAVSSVTASYRVKAGQRPGGPGGSYDGTFVEDYEYVDGLGDLDECNGRDGTTPDYPDGTYHYYLTSTFPFIPRCWKGTPDESFARRMPQQGQQPGQSPGGQPGQGTAPGQRPEGPPPRNGNHPFPPPRRPHSR